MTRYFSEIVLTEVWTIPANRGSDEKRVAPRSATDLTGFTLHAGLPTFYRCRD